MLQRTSVAVQCCARAARGIGARHTRGVRADARLHMLAHRRAARHVRALSARRKNKTLTLCPPPSSPRLCAFPFCLCSAVWTSTPSRVSTTTTPRFANALSATQRAFLYKSTTADLPPRCFDICSSSASGLRRVRGAFNSRTLVATSRRSCGRKRRQSRENFNNSTMHELKLREWLT